MISLTKDDSGLWIVTLDRVDKANALTEDMLSDLLAIARSATDARAMVLTGAGKVFSAGADLDAARAGLATSPLWEELSGAIAALPTLTIAALNGTLAGGAMGMALACDIRIAVPHANFFYPVMKHGFLPQKSDPKRMSALIGPARTKMVFVAGQKLSCDQAQSYGLVDLCVEQEELMPTARSLCADVLAAQPEMARAIKDLCP